ncbi:hypothetical protein [Fodinibius salsisoli]|uniref:Uncharacterized protein n=1 Tax=Fodinibius salsisoli TaxID=2820877 RepID=A0ABT3PM42_9BACT|nr:hypothetical protein [Fodinibius salsisoli]MCW9706977.1 hypothetical protein [Fodinibius salsisoli]
MKQYLFLILFLILVTAFCQAQQVPKDTVYISFDETSSETCLIDSGMEKDRQKTNKFRKIDTRNDLIFFHICNELFVFNKKLYSPDTTSTGSIPSQKIADIEDMNKLYNSLQPREFKHHVFDTVFILEQIAKNKVVKYDVTWNDEALGIIE